MTVSHKFIHSSVWWWWLYRHSSDTQHNRSNRQSVLLVIICVYPLSTIVEYPPYILCHILQIVSRERSSKKRKNQPREVSSVMMMSVTFRHHPSKGRRAATLLLLLFFTLHVRIVEINNVMYRWCTAKTTLTLPRLLYREEEKRI